MNQQRKNIIPILICFLILSSFISYAQDTSAEKTATAGITPDSALYNLELFLEGFQLILTFDPITEADIASSFLEERHAEMDIMLAQGNYDALAEAVDQAQDDSESLHAAIEDIPAIEENLDVIYEIQSEEIAHENHLEEIDSQLGAKVNAGELTAQAVEEVGITQLEESTVETQVVAENEESAIIDTIAEEQGITHIEAEIKVEQKAEESGVTDLQETEIRAELAESEKNVENLEIQIVQLEAAGTEIPNEVTTVLEEAKLDLQISKDNFEHGKIDDSFEALASAEQLILNTELVVENPAEFSDEIVDLAPLIEEHADERIAEAEEFTSEFEEAKEELIGTYPDKADEFAYDEEISERVTKLAGKVDEQYSREFETLITEGRSEEEATEALTEMIAAEYRIAYGEEYLPPGVQQKEAEAIPIGEVPLPAAETTSGGFIEDYTYEDPATDFKYEFTQNGYKYTTPLGFTYSETFPEGTEHAESFTEGEEVHTVTESTPEGTIEYNYYPTGYEVVMEDGTAETFYYHEGDYDLLGGGEVDIEETGFEIVSETGETTTYDYNPEYQNYVAKTDEGLNTFVPPEGTSLHQEEVDYLADASFYSYEKGGDTWVYNPATHSWSSSTGETYKPDASTVAPVGYESTGTFVTPTGESWSYDSSTGSWSCSGGTSDGASYNPDTNAYTTKEGESWSYDSSTGHWTSSTGEVQTDTSTTPGSETITSSFSFDPTTNSWTSASGESWSYDSSTGSWTSSTGESHAGPGPGDEQHYQEYQQYQQPH